MTDFPVVQEKAKYQDYRKQDTQNYADGHVLIVSDLTEVTLDKFLVFKAEIACGLTVGLARSVQDGADELDLDSGIKDLLQGKTVERVRSLD